MNKIMCYNKERKMVKKQIRWMGQSVYHERATKKKAESPTLSRRVPRS